MVPAQEWREWRSAIQYAEAIKTVRRKEMQYRYGEVGQALSPAERVSFADGLADAVRLIENLVIKGNTRPTPDRGADEEEAWQK